MRQETTAQLGKSSVEAAVSAAAHRASQAARLPPQRFRSPITDHRSHIHPQPHTNAFTLQKQRERASAHRRAVALCEGGFTLAELLVTIGVLVLVVFFATQLLKSAATVAVLGHKKMDA